MSFFVKILWLKIFLYSSNLDVKFWFMNNNEQAMDVEMNIRQIGDLERLISKVPLGKINPREVVQLKKALEAIVPTKALLEKSENAFLQKIAKLV